MKKEKLRFLIFDLVVYDGEYLANREYSKRLGVNIIKNGFFFFFFFFFF